MNATPHKHTPEIRTSYQYPWYTKKVVYGDTAMQIRFSRKTVKPKRLEKALRKVIAKHDAGSINAGKLETILQTVKSSWDKEEL